MKVVLYIHLIFTPYSKDLEYGKYDVDDRKLYGNSMRGVMSVRKLLMTM